MSVLVVGVVLCSGALGLVQPLEADESFDTVRGSACYRFGDNETPAQAKKAAVALAQEEAVMRHRVLIQASSTVKNFQLEEDLIQTASAAVLQDVQVEKQEKKEQEVCVVITARLSPMKLEGLIQQKAKAKDVAQTAQAPLLASSSSFGLKVWTNKAPGEPYVEGEPLVISVQSDRDAYLKLDYYQADGTVVHLVPNVYSGEAFIKAGKTYTFGDSGGPAPFRITGPFGAETIKAIASTQPFDVALSAGRNVEESKGYLKGLQSGLRGVRVEGTASWAEASSGLTTVSKAVVEHNEPLAGMRGVRKRPEPPDVPKPTPITGGTGERPSPPTPRP